MTKNPRISTLLPLIAFAVSIFLIGCGGGSGGGGSASNGGNGGSSGGTKQVESQLTNGSGVVFDPLNIQVNDRLQFVIASYDNSGNRTSIPVTGWNTTDSTAFAGVLSNDGTYVATTASSTVYTMSVNFNGTTYTIPYQVTPQQLRVSGYVLASGTGSPIPGIRIKVYKNGVAVASGKTNYQGLATISAPTGSTKFHLDPTTINTAAYYNSYSYNGLRFAPLIDTCVATLPTPIGTSVSLGSNVFIVPINATPPGPPTGCQ